MKLGTTELIVILAIVVLIFGPTQIPKLTKMFGKSVKSFKDGMEDDADAESKKASAKKVKKLSKVIFEIDGQQIDYKAIEKKAAKLGGTVYVVVGEKKLFDADGKSVDLF